MEPTKLPHRQELEVVPKPWNQAFLTAAETMSETLTVTNPTISAVLRLWYQEYTLCRYSTCNACNVYTCTVRTCTFM